MPDHHKYHTKSSNSFLVYQTEFNLSYIYQATILKYLIAKNTVQELETWEAVSQAIHFPSGSLAKRKKKKIVPPTKTHAFNSIHSSI